MLPVFRCPPILPDRERKRFLAFARNDDRGKGVLSCPRSPRAGKAAVGGILPPSVGRRCPEGAEDRSAPQGQPSMRRDERGCEIARSPASSSKAEPRDLNVIAAFCIGEETQKFFCRIVISQSLLYRCARKISRFARNDDTGQPSTRRDERGCEIVRLPVSSSKAEPRDLNVIAAFCIGEETQNFFAVSLSHSLRFTGVQGRFLASLEMTIRGQPSTRRDERGCEIARPPISSSRAEPRDLSVIAAFCIGEETQNFFVSSLSHNLRFTGVQGRFLVSLEMTIWGE